MQQENKLRERKDEMEETTDNDYISTFDKLESLSYDNPIRVITT